MKLLECFQIVLAALAIGLLHFLYVAGAFACLVFVVQLLSILTRIACYLVRCYAGNSDTD